MKKIIKLSLCVFSFVLLFSSCAKTRILNSKEAAEKLGELGYVVNLDIQYGEDVSSYGIQQLTILSADLGEDYIQVYYFTSEEDTDTFYKAMAKRLTSGVEAVKKNKYSIYRGTEKAVEDFLSLGNS